MTRTLLTRTISLVAALEVLGPVEGMPSLVMRRVCLGLGMGLLRLLRCHYILGLYQDYMFIELDMALVRNSVRISERRCCLGNISQSIDLASMYHTPGRQPIIGYRFIMCRSS